MRGRVDFVIIGAQKGATTELTHALAEHPQVALSANEEPFFRDPYYRPDGLGAFLGGFPPDPGVLNGIKCPDYLGHPEVAARLARDLDQPKLVVCLRDPVERAVSAYFWYVRWGVLPVLDVEEGLRQLLERPQSVPPAARSVLQYGLYGRHLTGYLEHFRRSSIHVTTRDRLVADFADAVAGVVASLGLPPAVTAPAPRLSNPSVYAPGRLRWLRLRNRHVVELTPGGTDVRIVVPDRVTTRLWSRAVGGVDRLALSRVLSNRPPTISAELRSRLEAYYAADLAVLATIVTDEPAPWLAPA